METVEITGNVPNLYVANFIKNMATAYVAAGLVISRTDAGSISELCLLDKAVILVPSPNVAEDHQAKSALALVNRWAVIYVENAETEEKSLPVALEAIVDFGKLRELSENIAHLALPNPVIMVAKEVIKLAQQPWT